PFTKAKDQNIPPWSSQCSLSITPCCSGISSTPASPEGSGSSYWLDKRRPSPLRCATSRGGGGGRSWPNGSALARPISDCAKVGGKTVVQIAPWSRQCDRRLAKSE